MGFSLAKQKIIAFYEAKNREVVKATGLKLYLKADLDEIRQGRINNITDDALYYLWFKHLVNCAMDEKYFFQPGLSGTTCIWCCHHDNYTNSGVCGNCTYGKRNGICFGPYQNNRYGKIILRARKREQGVPTLAPPTLAKRLSNEWYKKTILKVDKEIIDIS